MSRVGAVSVIAGAAAGLIVALAALLVPLAVRHSAPFGFSLTLDPARGIAVRGGLVTANYPNFDRVDLDLRAYDVAADYDLTVHVRPDEPGAGDVRTVRLSVRGDLIRHDKAPFADPYLSISFPPIADSAGRSYYVWVETGPRNRDDVLALWSVKSYSRVPGRAVLAAFLADPPGDTALGLVMLLLALVGGFGWLFGALVFVALGATVAGSRARSALGPASAVDVETATVVASNVQAREG